MTLTVAWAEDTKDTAPKAAPKGAKVLPKPIKSWTLTTLREKLIKIGAKVVRHSKYVLFQLAEVAVPRKLLARLLGWIARLCPAYASG